MLLQYDNPVIVSSATLNKNEQNHKPDHIPRRLSVRQLVLKRMLHARMCEPPSWIMNRGNGTGCVIKNQCISIRYDSSTCDRGGRGWQRDGPITVVSVGQCADAVWVFNWISCHHDLVQSTQFGVETCFSNQQPVNVTFHYVRWQLECSILCKLHFYYYYYY